MVKRKGKSEDIIEEWDKNAESRHMQIISKIDLSYNKVLVPTLIKLLGDIRQMKIIDIGCGSGVLTNKLARKGAIVVGVDPSKEMIRIANKEYGTVKGIKFHNQSIQKFSSTINTKFDLAVSNMSLITIENLQTVMDSTYSLLKPKGKFIFNITHPCFWNQYRQYESDKTFQYMTEHAQKGKFIITKDSTGLKSPTTHFHRPLERYFECLSRASFVIEELVEPLPNPSDMKLYPAPWKFPRFLTMKCMKIDRLSTHNKLKYRR